MSPEQFNILRQDFHEFLADLRETADRNASPWRTRRGAAAYLQCGVTKLDELVAEGKLPKKFFDGRPRFHTKDLDALITDRRR